MLDIFCLWCEQKHPNTIEERMNERLCNSPDGDSHMYSVKRENVCNIFPHSYVNGVCINCGTPTIEKLKEVSKAHDEN